MRRRALDVVDGVARLPEQQQHQQQQKQQQTKTPSTHKWIISKPKKQFQTQVIQIKKIKREEGETQQKKRKFEKENFNKEIENCCHENLLSLLKYFIQNQGANLKTKS